MNVDPETLVFESSVRSSSRMSTSGDDDYSAKGPYGHVNAAHRMKMLPIDFVPSDDDVICGRGKKCYSHVGNDRFRDRVVGVLEMYRQARTKLDKSKVLNMVVDQVRENSPDGGFVKQDEAGRWHEVGDFLAREKTSQAFRDALHENYKSSSVAKKKRRQDEMGNVKDRLKMPRSTVDIAQKIQSMSIQMKKAAAGSGGVALHPHGGGHRGDPNADIMAGIQYASRVMRHDANVGFPNIGGSGGNHNMPTGGNGFELEFEPDGEQQQYNVRSSNASTGMMSTGGGGGPSFGAPQRSRSMMDQHSDRSMGMMSAAAAASSSSQRIPMLGVNRSYSEGMHFQGSLRGMGDMMQMQQQQFLSNNNDNHSNYSGNENYSAAEESMTEELHHSAPNFELDPSDLMDDTDRMHRSAPTLCYYSSSTTEPPQIHRPAAVPSTIEFQIGTGGGGTTTTTMTTSMLAQQQHQLEQQQRQLEQQRQQLERMQLAQHQQLQHQHQVMASQQQHHQQQQQQQFRMMQGGGGQQPHQRHQGEGIISSLGAGGFPGMQLENDDNPFEPIPINEPPPPPMFGG